MNARALAVAGIATITVYAIPAVAHHSFAMFDASKTVTLEGSVKEFQWTNPHAWIMLTVTNPQGSGRAMGDRAQRPKRPGPGRLETEDADAGHGCLGDDPPAGRRKQWRPVPDRQVAGRIPNGPRGYRHAACGHDAAGAVRFGVFQRSESDTRRHMRRCGVFRVWSSILRPPVHRWPFAMGTAFCMGVTDGEKGALMSALPSPGSKRYP